MNVIDEFIDVWDKRFGKINPRIIKEIKESKGWLNEFYIFLQERNKGNCISCGYSFNTKLFGICPDCGANQNRTE